MTTVEMLSQVLGGIGLFLIGMLLTTDGLQAAAGDSLRRLLLRFTRTPIQSLTSGAIVTALVQSSSATTVATISFVTAGLLTFQQALGLILGANIGTTATGWIVALLGLKFSVSKIALPMIGVGALTRLFTRGRWRDVGMAVAGFGVLFVGLDVLQAGMSGASEFMTPDVLPSDTWGGRVALVGIGFLLTAIMQSSSAAIATTLTALDSGTISMMQAAAMAIGVNIGTTVTAGLAVLGAGTGAKRTALAHLMFNMLTGVVAFASLPVMVRIATSAAPSDNVIALAAFHTIFNVVGVVLVFPFIKQFATYVERVIPERGPRLTRMLAPALMDDGVVAMEAVRATTLNMAKIVVAAAESIVVLDDYGPDVKAELRDVTEALHATHAFVASLRNLDSIGARAQKRHVDTIHALDYLDQLSTMLIAEGDALLPVAPDNARAVFDAAVGSLALTAAWLEDPTADPPVEQLRAHSELAADMRRGFRETVLDQTALGEYSAVDAARDIDLVRRLDELVFHLWRFCARLAA